MLKVLKDDVVVESPIQIGVSLSLILKNMFIQYRSKI